MPIEMRYLVLVHPIKKRISDQKSFFNNWFCTSSQNETLWAYYMLCEDAFYSKPVLMARVRFILYTSCFFTSSISVLKIFQQEHFMIIQHLYCHGSPYGLLSPYSSSLPVLCVIVIIGCFLFYSRWCFVGVNLSLL